MPQFPNVQNIANWRLCLGCGACSYICPEHKIRLVDFADEGVRPIVETSHCGSCTDCLKVCPAFENDRTEINCRPGALPELLRFCGPVLEVWEGHAADSELRFRGASGGVLTALALYCLEREQMHGVLHVGMDPEDATRNSTRISRTRMELLDSAGSRYSPASVCDGLELVESAPGKCVVIGQPSEITATRKASRLRPTLECKIGLTLSFFCAGSPSRKGTLELLRKLGIAADRVERLRYRGLGWPGSFSVTLKGDGAPAAELTYAESWGFVQAYRPFSTHLCPDGSGEDADIACGDPWYREVSKEEPGLSLVVVRTETGRRLLRRALAAGYVSLTPAEPWKLLRSQENLWAKRGAIGGRIAALALMGLPRPELKGFSLFKCWMRLGLRDKLRSTFGTVRRAIRRNYFRPIQFDQTSPQVIPVKLPARPS